jgi:chemotaxis protein MotA
MMTIVGIVVAIMSIVISTIMDGNSFGALIGPSSLFLVVVGALGVTLSGFDIPDIKAAPKAMIVSFTAKLANGDDTVTKLMQFAEIARRDGVLALESSINELDDEFLKAGLQQVVDGLDADKVREVMEIELGAIDVRHQTNIAFWKAMGGYAPTMGMVGTVIGLINMLGNLSDPAQLGAGLSVALLTTLYGVIFANLVFLPIGSKLNRLHEAELTVKDMAIDGVIALQSGASPRAIVERLEAFLPPDSRQGLDVRSGKKAA